jgi:MFS family permease
MCRCAGPHAHAAHSYILLQIPSSNLMLWLGRPRLYMGLAIIVWGGISTATAAADSYSHLLVIRIFLGVVEAAFFPGCVWRQTWSHPDTR